ncbi:hypothetical protein [Lutibacter sp.]
MDKKDILNSLIQDTQENSRFIESKTAIITAIIGAILIYYLQDIENIIKYFCSFSRVNYFFLFLVIISTAFNVCFLFKIIFPTDNPKSKIPDNYKDFPNLYLSKEHLNTANPNLIEFQDSFSNDLNTEKAMELEYVKTSYIRNSKLSSYRILIFGVLIQVILFIIHLVIYNSELIRLTAE